MFASTNAALCAAPSIVTTSDWVHGRLDWVHSRPDWVHGRPDWVHGRED